MRGLAEQSEKPVASHEEGRVVTGNVQCCFRPVVTAAVQTSPGF